MTYQNPPATLPRGSHVDLYLRYSSDGQSLESQEHALCIWAQSHGLIIRHIYRDEAISGKSTAGRTAFLNMFHELVEGRAEPRPDGVILWSFARFAREIEGAEYHKWALRHFGYIVWSLTDNIPDGEYAALFETLAHIQDARFLKRLREETKRGLHYRASLGYWAGGFPPVGYITGPKVSIGRKKNGEERTAYKLVFDPATQSRVQMAWAMRIAGKSYLAIHHATHLFPNQNNYADLFEKVTYAGAVKCGDEIFWDAHPAYVTRAEFDQVTAMRKPRTARAEKGERKQTRQNTVYLLSGILRCGICGWAMCGNKTNGVLSYRCDWRHRQGHAQARCTQPSIVAYALHAPVLAWLKSDVFTFERMRAARERVNALLSGDCRDLFERLEYLRAEQKRLNQVLSRLADVIERGLGGEMEERYRARQGELAHVETELCALTAQLNAGKIIVTDDALRVIVEEMNETLQALADEGSSDLRALVAGTIKKAELSADKLTLFYSPLPFLRALNRAYPVVGDNYVGMVGAPNGIRTRVLALKGPRPSPLDDRDTCADDYMQNGYCVK